MKLSFTKMHGCGNNYIYINCFDQKVTDPEKLSIALSEPHFGIGGDGIILISPSDRADAQMRIFNADGSEGKMCGNGIRCVGKYLYDNGMVGGRTTITIDTLSGVKTLELNVRDGKMQTARVDPRACKDPGQHGGQFRHRRPARRRRKGLSRDLRLDGQPPLRHLL